MSQPPLVPWVDDRSDTPRTDAFIDTLPPIPMNNGPVVAAEAMRAHMIAWAEFARGLERELSRKVWPH